MNLRRYNPFPVYVWTLMFITFAAGYFIGNIVQSFAIENNIKNSCNHLINRMKQ